MENSRAAMTHTHEPRLLLDCLPLELRERIAVYVSCGGQNNHALNLALTSVKQRFAVLNVRRRKLRIRTSDERWSLLVADSAVEIIILPSVEPLTFTESSLRSWRLLRAEIPAIPLYLQNIRFARRLQKLTLILDHSASPQVILHTLVILNLSEINLLCSRTKCYTALIVDAGKGPDILGKCCRGLERLGIFCHNHDPIPVWCIAKHFSSLRSLSFNSDVPNDAIPALAKLDAVLVEESPWSHDLAIQIGSSVTKFGTNRFLNVSQVAALAACPYLRELDVSLEDGAEEHIEFGNMLETLCLRWNPFIMRGSVDETYFIGPGIASEGHATYYSPLPLSLSRLVQSAPNLNAIVLTEVVIPMSELTMILKSLGKGLQKLVISIEMQLDDPLHRLIKTMECAARFNSGLHQFEVQDAANFMYSFVIDETMSPAGRRHFRSACNRLALKAPHADINLDACRLFILEEFRKFSKFG